MLALRDGKSRSEAYEYAEGRFNDRFKDFENGQLTIYFRFESKNIKGDQLHHNDIQDIIAYAKMRILFKKTRKYGLWLFFLFRKLPIEGGEAYFQGFCGLFLVTV